MCFVWIWEQTAIISLYNINWLVCITETGCVYCAVRTGYIIHYIFVFEAEARALSWVNPCKVCGRRSGTGTVSSESFWFSLVSIIPWALHSLHLHDAVTIWTNVRIVRTFREHCCSCYRIGLGTAAPHSAFRRLVSGRLLRNCAWEMRCFSVWLTLCWRSLCFEEHSLEHQRAAKSVSDTGLACESGGRAAQFGAADTGMGNAQAKGPHQKNRAHKKYVHWDQAGKRCCAFTVMGGGGGGAAFGNWPINRGVT
jgi:hypothetical protein